MNTKNGREADSNQGGLVFFLQRFGTDEACREFLEAKRWPKGVTCPRCEATKVYKLEGETTRKGLYKCAMCRKPFTVTVGTIFESSHIPLPKWFAAIYLMCSSKKGVSAHQIHRQLVVTYKSAWFMCHRIREAMRNPSFRRTLSGTVQVDEAYIGGKTRIGKRGKASERKTPVAALISRTQARTRVVSHVNAKELHGFIKDHVKKDATIVTDDASGYSGITKHYHGGHQRVVHSRGEYVNKLGFTTNTAESFFALLKRGVRGTFHHVSKDHLARYCTEFEFRWNNRKATDTDRTFAALNWFHGKRLMYRDALS